MKIAELATHPTLCRGVIDETDHAMSSILPMTGAYHVLRLLRGANVIYHPASPQKKETYEILANGSTYLIAADAFAIIRRVADSMKANYVDALGCCIADPEQFYYLHDAACKALQAEMIVNENKLRVLYLLGGENGCGWYRVMKPVEWLNKTEGGSVHAEYTRYLNYSTLCQYDVIVAPRVFEPEVIRSLLAVQLGGRLLVYETDDLMSAIPDWSPAREAGSIVMDYWRQRIRDHADGIIVSTEELRGKLERPDVTHVAHNGIDPADWPMQAADQSGDVVRFIWAGSDTHEKDLEIIKRPIINALNRWKDRMQLVFVGWIPPWGAELAKQRRGQVLFTKGCAVHMWGWHLAQQKANVALAPLIRCPFNDSKSELKVLEAWALGVPILASRSAPYDRAITHDQDGLLLNDDAWGIALDRMVADREARDRIGRAGLAALRTKNYLAEQTAIQHERALLKVAVGKVRRQPCADSIAKRLAELGVR